MAQSIRRQMNLGRTYVFVFVFAFMPLLQGSHLHPLSLLDHSEQTQSAFDASHETHSLSVDCVMCALGGTNPPGRSIVVVLDIEKPNRLIQQNAPSSVLVVRLIAKGDPRSPPRSV